MNYGPLELAAYLHRNPGDEPATVKAARAASPGASMLNRLTAVSGRQAVPGEVTVCEIIAARTADAPDYFDVLVRPAADRLVLVLSSHEAVAWRLALLRGVTLEAILLSGRGGSTVTGAGDTPVSNIGGYYAFRPGTAAYRHLESRVRDCTGHGAERAEDGAFELEGLLFGPGEGAKAQRVELNQRLMVAPWLAVGADARRRVRRVQRAPRARRHFE
jgi:hypothetical protein